MIELGTNYCTKALILTINTLSKATNDWITLRKVIVVYDIKQLDTAGEV